MKYFLLILFLLYGLLINTHYRPYIYKNNLNDFGIADMGNNITFIPMVYFLLITLRTKFLFGRYKDIFLHFFILSTVEVLSYFFKYLGNFDFKDILGLFFGAVITYFLASRYNFTQENTINLK